MKTILNIFLVLFCTVSVAQQNINAKIVKADSLRARIDTLNLINLNQYSITVNDTLLTDYIGEHGGGGVTFPLLAPNNLSTPMYSFNNNVNTGLGILGNNVFLQNGFITGNVNIQATGLGGVFIEGIKYPSSDGTVGQVLTTDGSGELSFQEFPSSNNTYLPVVSNLTNIASISPTITDFFRIGSLVSISGVIFIDKTSDTGAASFNMTIPITSNFNSQQDASGLVLASEQSDVGSGTFRALNGDSVLVFLLDGTTVGVEGFHFYGTYRIE